MCSNFYMAHKTGNTLTIKMQLFYVFNCVWNTKIIKYILYQVTLECTITIIIRYIIFPYNNSVPFSEVFKENMLSNNSNVIYRVLRGDVPDLTLTSDS